MITKVGSMLSVVTATTKHIHKRTHSYVKTDCNNKIYPEEDTFVYEGHIMSREPVSIMFETHTQYHILTLLPNN